MKNLKQIETYLTETLMTTLLEQDGFFLRDTSVGTPSRFNEIFYKENDVYYQTVSLVQDANTNIISVNVKECERIEFTRCIISDTVIDISSIGTTHFNLKNHANPSRLDVIKAIKDVRALYRSKGVKLRFKGLRKFNTDSFYTQYETECTAYNEMFLKVRDIALEWVQTDIYSGLVYDEVLQRGHDAMNKLLPLNYSNTKMGKVNSFMYNIKQATDRITNKNLTKIHQYTISV